MEQVETKHFIKNKEVVLIAERFGTKIYQDNNTFYIVNLDELVATFKLPKNDKDSLTLEDECRIII